MSDSFVEFEEKMEKDILDKEKGKKMNEWIKCDDQKPPSKENVLIYLNGKVYTGYYECAWFGYDEIFETYNPSHWMPMPIPPKEQPCRSDGFNSLPDHFQTILAKHMAREAELEEALRNAEQRLKMYAGFDCPYCGASDQEAGHDAICEKHPAVIRATQAEAERDVLAEFLFNDNHSSSPNYWIEKARDEVAKQKEKTEQEEALIQLKRKLGICRYCSVPMVRGIAMKQSAYQGDEGTCSFDPNTTGETIEVLKCPECGYSQTL